MSIGLPSEVAALTGRVAEFVREVVIPAEPAPGDVLADDVRAELMSAARAAGVFAPQVSKEFGGGGLPLQWWSPVFQAAGYSPIGPSVLNCMAPDEGNMRMLELIATPEQAERYLRPLAEGRIRSCFAMTEPHPGAGSDPAMLTTTARQTDGGWLVSGRKRFISGADGAGFAIIMARAVTAEGDDLGATMFLSPMDAPGIEVGRHIPTLDRTIVGGHPHVRFDDLFVPDHGTLGAVGEGFRYAQVRLGPARLTHCMRWLGLARRALDIAIDRASARSVFGAPLAELGLAQGPIADSVIDIETADAIIAETAHALVDDPKRGAHLSAIAKVHTSDAVGRVIDRAMQLCGGDGMSHDLPLAQYMNEVRPFRVYDGSNETHRWAIAGRAVRARRREIESGRAARADLVPDGDLG